MYLSLSPPLLLLLLLLPFALSHKNTLTVRDELSDLFYCPASSWPDAAVGTAITPQPADSSLRSIIQQISVRNIETTINKLVSFGTRNTLSAGKGNATYGVDAARDWIAEQMRGYAESSGGRMTVEVQTYLQQPASAIPFAVNISNVVATLKGSEDADRYYVVSGHLDSRVTNVDNYTAFSPGADDDASGVAISMELARIMATLKPKATIVFAAVSAEEQGLYGSTYLANTYKNASINVAGMFTNDIVGSSTSDTGAKDPYNIRLFAQGVPSTENATEAAERLSIGGENDSPARELARFVGEVASNAATGMTVDTIYRADRFLRGGDHLPFLAAGYAAARFTEPNENFAHQHQDVRVQDGLQYGDLAQFVDYQYVRRAGAVNAAAIWSLANAPAQPASVRVDTTVLTNNSTFYWQAPVSSSSSGSVVDHYEVVWRATASPAWTHVVNVGNTTKATLLLSKDNVIFGVRSVGANGYHSPAVLPFPITIT